MKSAIRLFCLAAAVSGVWAGPATAALSDYEGKVLKAITFKPESQPYAPGTLEEMLPLKTGKPLRLADVRDAIERLYATGRYEDIAVDARLEEEAVVLTFITSPNFFVGRITVEGVPEPPNQDVLINATRLELGTLFTDGAVKQAVSNLETSLRQNGFYESSISPRFEHDPATQQVRIHFVIRHGGRARYAPPIFAGVPERNQNDLLDATKWKGWFGWQKVTDARTGEGIDRVLRWYRKRGRLEAAVSLEKLDYNSDTDRVTPLLKVDPGPKIDVRIVGAGISRGKMRQLVPVYEEQSVDRDLLVEGAGNIREYLEGKGYFNPSVDFKLLKKDGDAEQVIEYTVDRGERHKVIAVDIRGNKYFDQATLRERMYVRPATILQFRHGRYSESLLERDVEAIESLYRSNGFRDVVVSSRVDQGAADKRTDLTVHVQINEGVQWLVGKLELEGVLEENREAVLGMLQSQEGQPFSEFNIAIDRENVLTYYYNRGYHDALFEYHYVPAAEPHRAELRYRITEGPQKYVRQVLISGGLESTDERLVRERVLLEPGDVLSRSAMLETQRRLYDLGIFARVDMALQNPDGDERDKYVLLGFEEAKKWTLTGGLGAEIAKIGGCSSCLEAPAGETGFSPRVYFGVTRRNFLGMGHIISLQSRASTLQRRAVLSYTAPQFRGNPDVSLLFSALYDDSREVRTFMARRREVSAQIGQQLSRASTILYRLTYRRVSVSDLNLILDPVLLPQYLQPVQMGIIGGNYIYDRRDDPTETHRGIYNTIDAGYGVMPGTSAQPGVAGYLRLLGHNAPYHPFGLGSKYVLARAITVGWLQRPSASRDVPLPERFFAGGAASHRGFPYNQAGPRDLETGFPLGGRAVLLNQIELRYPMLGENISGTLFLDSGNVYSGLDKISFRVRQKGLEDFNYMVHAVGFGIRYRTPVGPVRLDLAYSINPPRFYGCEATRPDVFSCPEKKDQRIGHFQFHFSIGQAF